LQTKPKKTPPRAAGRAPRAAASRRPATPVALAALAAVAALVLLYLLELHWGAPNLGAGETAATNAVAAVAPVGAVRVTEVMSSNKTAVPDEAGKYPDWVELFNAAQEPVDITGWSLTDNMDKLVRFTFPEMTLAPGEYVVVYCDDDLKNTAGYPFHAPFKLSAQGDQVLLFDREGDIMHSLTVPALQANQSYRLNADGDWEVSAEYTPGLPNTEEAFAQAAGVVTESAVRLSEVMADNKSYAGRNGVYDDWIELYNASDAAVSLRGYALTDDPSKPFKWRFPDVTIPARGYLLVYASGRADADMDASFKLNAEGETVVLSDASGRALDRVDYGLLSADQSFSREGDGWTGALAPTPGMANTKESADAMDALLASANTVRVFLNEAAASARQPGAAKSAPDWVELYNQSLHAVDLSGYGLSDDPDRPRKWRFPSGTKIEAGGYLRVLLNGLDKADLSKNAFAANFKLSLSGRETLVLATPEGAILDRMPLLTQYGGVSYGRISGRDGFFYLESATPGALNSQTPYQGRVESVSFSEPGGFYTGGVTVALLAPEGADVRYTLDATEPTEASPRYEGPIALSETTVLRARAFRDGMLPSLVSTHTYLFAAPHTLDVISLVADPAGLFDEEKGLLVMGPKKLKYPFKGANFWQDWERAAHVEYFTADGETLLSQGAGLQLQGQYSRMEDQKAFKISARNAYGDNRFRAAIFPNRDYAQVKSFLLRASGQDANKTRYRDALLTSLAAATSVMYQDARPVAVYLNGQYWGHYNLRERIHKYSIAQFMGWKEPDKISIVKANDTVMQGSDKTFQQLLSYVKKNGVRTDEDIAYVESKIDLENYLEYIALETFIGNTDLLNVKRYRSDEGDGRWRWIIFDPDWAFYTDTDSFGRWLKAGGMGSGNKTDNSLFIALMKNKTLQQRYLTLLGRLMSTEWTTRKILEKSQQWQDTLYPEMPAQTKKWGGNEKGWLNAIKSFNNYAKTRPKKLLTYIQRATGYTKAEMRVYFGDIMDQIEAG
jgi:hypothetical protein